MLVPKPIINSKTINMIQGIDVYHNDPLSPQGVAEMIRKHELYFAFIKSSTGANGRDPAFANYWNMCRTAGLLCGPYHWLWPTTDATAQALNFVAQYRTVSRAGVLPPVVDVEWTWNAKDPQTNANELWHSVPQQKRIPFIKEYLLKVETELNIKPIIYTAASFWNELLQPASSSEDNAFFAQYLLWIADPNNNKRLPVPWKDKGALFRQTHFGENSGSSDPFDKTDQNICNGSLKELLNSTAPNFTIMRGFPYSNIVKDIQAELKKKNFLSDEPDGFFGKNTETGVKNFQKAIELVDNGIIDAQTWNKLL